MRRRSDQARFFLGLCLVCASLLVGLAGCASGEGAPASGAEAAAPVAPSTTSAPLPSAPTTPVPTVPTVAVGETALGEVLVDGEGFALYRSTIDAPGESSCIGPCTDTWMPVQPETTVRVASDLDATLFGRVNRPDGMAQLTIERLPLYRFSGDHRPGEVNGQAAGGVWFAVTADGSLFGVGADDPDGLDDESGEAEGVAITSTTTADITDAVPGD